MPAHGCTSTRHHPSAIMAGGLLLPRPLEAAYRGRGCGPVQAVPVRYTVGETRDACCRCSPLHPARCGRTRYARSGTGSPGTDGEPRIHHRPGDRHNRLSRDDATQAGLDRGAGRRREDGGGEGTESHAGDGPHPPPVLRGARCQHRPLRVELSQADAAYQDGGGPRPLAARDRAGHLQ